MLVQGPPPPEAGRNGAGRHHAAASHLRLPPAPGSTSSPTRRSASSSPRRARGSPGPCNSQSNRLTPWSNDPVSDPPGEVVYLRDEETGEVWSPTPLPVPSAEPILVRHGQGYTVFERNTHGLAHELTLFVPPEDPVKLIRLKVRNAERPAARGCRRPSTPSGCWASTATPRPCTS